MATLQLIKNAFHIRFRFGGRPFRRSLGTVGRDEATIRAYIRNQEEEDKRLDQLKRRSLTHRVHQAKRGKPDVSPQGKATRKRSRRDGG